MSESTSLCSICLKTNNAVQSVCENDDNNVQIIIKLKCGVPDVEWYPDFLICISCCNQLNVVYSFREMCLYSQKIRLQSSLQDSVRKKDVEISNDYNDSYAEFDFDDPPIKELSDCEDNSDNTKVTLLSVLRSCKEMPKIKDNVLLNGTPEIEVKNTAKRKSARSKQFECPGCKKKYTTEAAAKKHAKVCKKMQESIEGTRDEGNDEGQQQVRTSSRDPPVDIDGASTERTGTETHLGAQERTRTEPASEDRPPDNVCPQCGARFSNKYLVRRHERNVHAAEKRFGCAQCPQRFAAAVYLAAHERYHRRERSHICATCGKGYITASDLHHHEKIHANERAYRCEACGKAFNTSSDLHKHRICVHVDRSQWKYVCTYCERRFPLKTNLDTHTKTHTGERQFACHLCDRRCINRSVLMRHIDTHSNVQSFKCHVCLHTYKYKKSLDLHLAKVHGMGNLPTKVKRYFCHICPKSYFVNSKLQKHLRMHTGDKPFKCPACQKGFVDKSYVKQHMKVTHGVTDWQQP